MKQVEFQDTKYKGLVPSRSFVEASRLIKRVVNKRSIGAIYGSPGLGKSTVRQISLGRYEESDRFKVIYVENIIVKPDLTSSIMGNMVKELTGNTPSRNSVMLTTQLKEALTLVSKEKTIIVCIDEAQDFKPATFYGLKKMHEIGKKFGRENLFSILLFGKPDLRNKISEYELGFRIQQFQMKPMNLEEVKELCKRFDLKFTNQRLYDAFFRECHGLPLAAEKIISAIRSIQNERKKMDVDQAFSFYITGHLNKQVKDLGISNTEISRFMYAKYKKHVDASTINRANRGEINTPLANEIREATQEIIREKQKEV